MTFPLELQQRFGNFNIELCPMTRERQNSKTLPTLLALVHPQLGLLEDLLLNGVERQALPGMQETFPPRADGHHLVRGVVIEFGVLRLNREQNIRNTKCKVHDGSRIKEAHSQKS